MSEPATILVVEDELPTRTFLADNLTADGYELLVAGTVRDALRTLEYHEVDLAVARPRPARRLGARAPARACARPTAPASRLDPRLPLIVLAGRAGETDRVRGFERGADDFVAKPFGYVELRLRIAAVLRRARERPLRRAGCASASSSSIRSSREVRLRGERVALSQKEFALLRALAAEPTRVLTKAELLRDVWGFRALGRDADARLRTPAGCARSSAAAATATWSTSGASATGCSTAMCRRRRPRPPRGRWGRRRHDGRCSRPLGWRRRARRAR